MACFLTAPNNYLDQYWRFISSIHTRTSSSEDVKIFSKLPASKLLREQWVDHRIDTLQTWILYMHTYMFHKYIKYWGRYTAITSRLKKMAAISAQLPCLNTVSDIIPTGYYLILTPPPPHQHDDVIKMKHFSRYWPFMREFIGDWWITLTKASDAELWRFLWSVPWINGWVNNREGGDSRRHLAHYDVIVT